MKDRMKKITATYTLHQSSWRRHLDIGSPPEPISPAPLSLSQAISKWCTWYVQDEFFYFLCDYLSWIFPADKFSGRSNLFSLHVQVG